MPSDCNACFYAGDYEAPEFYVRTVRVARKEHSCSECYARILPGERYEHVSAKWEEILDSFPTCLVCVEIRDAFACEGFVHTTVWSDIREGMFESMTTACLEKLSTAAAKAKLLKEWNEWKFGQ